MPTILYQWDFEDGTAQGWEGDLQVESNSVTALPLQGNYHIRVNGTATYSGIDLSNVNRAYIYFLYAYAGSLEFRIRDSGGNIIYNSPTLTAPKAYTYIYVDDISSVVGNSNLTLEIYTTSDMFVDLITIVSDVDYYYTTGYVCPGYVTCKPVSNIPDSDISTNNIYYFAIYSKKYLLNNSNYKYGIVIDNNEYAWYNGYLGATYNYNQQAQTLNSTFVEIDYDSYDYAIDSGSYYVVLSDNSVTLQRIYRIDYYLTVNPSSPHYVIKPIVTTYGTTASGSQNYTVQVHGLQWSLAFQTSCEEGTPSSGSITLDVIDPDNGTTVGTTSIDLSNGCNQTSSYITGLEPDKQYTARLSWSVSSTTRTVIDVKFLYRVGQ